MAVAASALRTTTRQVGRFLLLLWGCGDSSEGINLTVVVFIMAAPSVQEDERSVESDREMGVAPNVGSFTSFSVAPNVGGFGKTMARSGLHATWSWLFDCTSDSRRLKCT